MQGWQDHSKKRKASLVFLAILALFFLVMGVKAMPGKLISPFHLLPAGSSGVDLNKSAKEQQALAELKTKDTDQDGLSDYDELYVYHTSPYLADTDSDDFDDKQEIASGNDPNCPAGQDCRAIAGSLPSSTEMLQKNLQKNLLPENSAPSATGTSGTEITDWSLLQNFDLTPDQLRTLLKQSGFSEDELNKIDDATLKEVWRSTLKSAPTPNLSNSDQTAPASGGAAVSPPELKAPTAAELRKMLKDAGLDQTILDKLSDAEILKMYEEIIKK